MRPVIGLWLLLLAWPADAPAASPSAQDAALALASNVARSLSTQGPIAWLQYFDTRPGFSLVNDGVEQMSSYEQAQTFLPQFAAKVRHMDLVWSNLRAEAVGPDAAYLSAGYREDFQFNPGGTGNYTGFFSALAVRTPQGWKLRKLHWSSLPGGQK